MNSSIKTGNIFHFPGSKEPVQAQRVESDTNTVSPEAERVECVGSAEALVEAVVANINRSDQYPQIQELKDAA